MVAKKTLKVLETRREMELLCQAVSPGSFRAAKMDGVKVPIGATEFQNVRRGERGGALQLLIFPN